MRAYRPVSGMRRVMPDAEPNDATPFLPESRGLQALRRAPDEPSRAAERRSFTEDLRTVADALG